jgi:hypothetical protein
MYFKGCLKRMGKKLQAGCMPGGRDTVDKEEGRTRSGKRNRVLFFPTSTKMRLI